MCRICLEYFFRGPFSLLLRAQDAACLQDLCQGPSCREIFSDRNLCPFRGVRSRQDNFIVFIEEPALCSRINDNQKTGSSGQKNVFFDGGCNGNGKGIAALVEGMEVQEAVSRLKGITCGMKPTSCPDQLAIALEQSLQQLNG